ncbi:hypothetical protein BgiMline_034935 [Biomphalaria glabrata]
MNQGLSSWAATNVSGREPSTLGSGYVRPTIEIEDISDDDSMATGLVFSFDAFMDGITKSSGPAVTSWSDQPRLRDSMEDNDFWTS